MAISGKEIAKLGAVSVVGAGITLLAGYGLMKWSSVPGGPMGRELIVTGLGVVALIGASAYGRPIIGVALAAPMFYLAGSSLWMRTSVPASVLDAYNRALAAVGMAPASVPAASTPAALPSGTQAPSGTAPANYPMYSVRAY